MKRAPVCCPLCRAPLLLTALNTGHPSPCPSCGTLLMTSAFPALLRGPLEGSTGEVLGEDGEAGCFYHERKKAAVVCDTCGRFLCTLCDMDFGGRHLCPACLESAGEEEMLKELKSHWPLYDNIALAVALLPLIMFPVTLVTAPYAIYFSFRHWRMKSGILPRSRVRYVAAVLLAGIQVAGWGWFLISGVA